MNSDLQHYNKNELNLKILNSIAFYFWFATQKLFCRTSSSRAVFALSFPQNHQALSVAGCQQGLVVVEADAQNWTGMPLQLVETRTAVVSDVKKVHAAVFTPTH